MPRPPQTADKTTSLTDIRVEALMQTDAGIIRGDTPLRESALLMSEQGHSCLTVVEADQPVGILTERDMLHALHALLNAGDNLDGPSADRMTPSPETIKVSATAFEALVICKTHRIRHLPVVNDRHEYVGLVTFTALANAHVHLIDQQTEAIERAIEIRTRELEQANRNLQSMALTDALLEIGNRRAMEVDLRHTLAASDRYHRPCSIMLIDIDHFKQYNDHYGHYAGDLALQVVTNSLRALMRESDRLYRYGGEEFLCLLPETESTEAMVVAERLVGHLHDQRLPHAAADRGVITISIGVAGIAPHSNMQTLDEPLIEQADAALYQAKRTGRNRACLHPPLALVDSRAGPS